MTSPEGAEVSVNGVFIGESPLTHNMELSTAEFVVELSLKGHEPKRARLSWANARDNELTLNLTMQALPQPKPKPRRRPRRRTRPKPSRPKPSRPAGEGFISVKSPTWGHIYIDRRFVKESQVLLKHKVRAGQHTVKVCFNGDRSNCQERRVNVSPNSNEKVFF
jgi:hypothetical protein